MRINVKTQENGMEKGINLSTACSNRSKCRATICQSVITGKHSSNTGNHYFTSNGQTQYNSDRQLQLAHI